MKRKLKSLITALVPMIIFITSCVVSSACSRTFGETPIPNTLRGN